MKEVNNKKFNKIWIWSGIAVLVAIICAVVLCVCFGVFTPERQSYESEIIPNIPVKQGVLENSENHIQNSPAETLEDIKVSEKTPSSNVTSDKETSDKTNIQNTHSSSKVSNTADTSDKSNTSNENTPDKTNKSVKISSATILSTGDIMVHDPQLNGAKVAGKNEWDFTAFFKEVDSYFLDADFSVANLETTFASNKNKPYAGYPTFNTPDSLIDAIKDSGLSMVLTANNHCYDTGADGFERTQNVLKKKGVRYIGTRLNENAPKYRICEIKEIRVGMVAYTYETGKRNGLKTINGITVSEKHNNLVNSFSYGQLNEFYAEVDEIMAKMKASGVDATIFYIHWGDEYKIVENSNQNKIAQELCNRGVDVIVGGHPHVIQPIDMLSSKDGKHKTVCAYSLGNAISNQRRERMDSCPSGHTEDGLLFYCTFDKYSDGKVVLAGVDAIPTWVNTYKGGSGYQYSIYPLEKQNDGEEVYKLTGTNLTKSRDSYKRTIRIITKGLNKCQKELGCEITSFGG